MQVSWSQGGSEGGNDMSPSLAEHLLEQPVLFSSLLLLQDAGVLGRHPGVLGSELLAPIKKKFNPAKTLLGQDMKMKVVERGSKLNSRGVEASTRGVQKVMRVAP